MRNQNSHTVLPANVANCHLPFYLSHINYTPNWLCYIWLGINFRTAARNRPGTKSITNRLSCFDMMNQEQAEPIKVMIRQAAAS
jgi:hypothetical protein